MVHDSQSTNYVDALAALIPSTVLHIQ